MAADKDNYSADDIENLSFPDDVRAKPGMYIGSVDEGGVFSILREPLDNVVDEALSNRATQCSIHIDDNTFYVWDDGNGIPRGKTKHRGVDGKIHEIDTIKAVCSMLHTSGKFKDQAYKISRGTHGIGIKATNALSSSFKVQTFYKGSWTTIVYQRGIEKAFKLTGAKPAEHPVTGRPLKKGTMITFEPDTKIFKPCKLRLRDVGEWASIAAYFTPNFKIELSFTKGTDIVEKTFHQPDGPRAFIANRIATLKAELLKDKTEPFFVNTAIVDCVAHFTGFDGIEMNAFTNGLKNVEGGVHASAFYKAIVDAITPYKKAKQEFGVNELKDGIILLLNVKLSHPAFSSQNKEKLTDERADKPVYEVLTKELGKYFKENKVLAELLCERADSLKSLKEDFLKSKAARKAIKNAGIRGFNPKALVAADAKPHERELYIVEGLSAAGGGVTARGWWQEVLPLRGKVINALRDPVKALESDSIIQILAHIGYKPDSSDPLNELRVNKVILMADPDPDGPLAADTLIPVQLNGETEWRDIRIEDLASDEYRNTEYNVRTWDGKKFIAASAHDCRATDYSTECIEIRLESGAKVQCHPNHVWLVLKHGHDPRLTKSIHNQFWWLHSRSVKSGDKLLVEHEGKLVESLVQKVKHHSLREPAAYYCLTVHSFGSFVLSNGMFSKNCHINSLLLTLFRQFLPGMFDRNMVYVTEVPEFYSINKKGDMLYSHSVDDLRVKLQKADWPAGAVVNHIKGYGEVSPAFLKKIVFDPTTRMIRRIKPIEDANGETEFVKIMGESTEGRRLLLGI